MSERRANAAAGAEREPARAEPAPRERRDVVVIGGGPAGLAAAAELGRLGVRDVLVLEREREAGGIPRHAAHTGFGLRDMRRVLSGPAYARRWLELAERSGAEVRTGTMVTGWSGDGALEVTAPAGRAQLAAGAVVLATGCRERPRSARLVPGSRPQGVLTTGMLQQLVYLERARLGGAAVIVGAEHVSFSAVLTLAHAGARVACLVTEQPHHQTLAPFRLGARLRYGARVASGTELAAIHGRRRVEAVDLRDLRDGSVRRVACDLVVFTADWIPDNELALQLGVEVDGASRSPLVDGSLRTAREGLFAAGNVLHGAEAADVAALTGRHVAGPVADYLAGGGWPDSGVRVRCEPPLRWVSPMTTRAEPPRGRFVLRTGEFRRMARLTVRQDGRELWGARRARLVPGRSLSIPAGWIRSVDQGGGAVTIGVLSA